MLPQWYKVVAVVGLYGLFYYVASGCPFKEWQNVAGAPGTGLHAIRIFDLPVVDVAGVLLGAWWLSRKTGWNFGAIVVTLVAISVPVHMLLGIQTELMAELIGYNPECRI